MEDRKIQETQLTALDPERYPVLDLLPFPVHWRMKDGQTPEVLDLLRKKWLVLTPEEWVRQHVLHWLLYQTSYPAGLISVERRISEQSFRTDVLAYSRSGKPALLVECKESRVPVTKETLMQCMKYNQHLGARFLWVTNGKNHLVLEVNDRGEAVKQHAGLPPFEEIIGERA
jgi:hypothetical protein